MDESFLIDFSQLILFLHPQVFFAGILGDVGDGDDGEPPHVKPRQVFSLNLEMGDAGPVYVHADSVLCLHSQIKSRSAALVSALGMHFRK